MSDKPTLSIIVCTYNRASLLKNCLQSLEKQTTNKKNYEVIVINNNSSDNTSQVVKDLMEGQLSNIKEVIERKQGLSYARNHGWKKARGKYVAYIDDDATAECDWVEQILKFIKRKPNINAFGGPYSRFSTRPFPDWLPQNYFTLNLGNTEKTLDLKKEWISGSNMIFNKMLFYKYGGFRTDLGMKGSKILYGEETEFLIRLRKGGTSVYYVPKIRVKHLVPEGKLRLWWLLKCDYRGSYIMAILKKSKISFFKGIIYFLLALLLIPVYLIDKKKGVIKRRWYYGLSNIFLSLGQIAGSIYCFRVEIFNK